MLKKSCFQIHAGDKGLMVKFRFFLNGMDFTEAMKKRWIILKKKDGGRE